MYKCFFWGIIYFSSFTSFSLYAQSSNSLESSLFRQQSPTEKADIVMKYLDKEVQLTEKQEAKIYRLKRREYAQIKRSSKKIDRIIALTQVKIENHLSPDQKAQLNLQTKNILIGYNHQDTRLQKKQKQKAIKLSFEEKAYLKRSQRVSQ